MAKILDLQLDAEDTAEKLCKISVEAGEAIMEVYGSDDFNIETKDDRTPVTAADKRSNAVIVSALNRLWPEISVLAEESEDNITRLRRRWCFVVDPLDGTKEFISRNGEFTVNIALVFDGNPVIGVIYVPVTGELYKGINWRGVRRAEQKPAGCRDRLDIRAAPRNQSLRQNRRACGYAEPQLRFRPS